MEYTDVSGANRRTVCYRHFENRCEKYIWTVYSRLLISICFQQTWTKIINGLHQVALKIGATTIYKRFTTDAIADGLLQKHLYEPIVSKTHHFSPHSRAPVWCLNIQTRQIRYMTMSVIHSQMTFLFIFIILSLPITFTHRNNMHNHGIIVRCAFDIPMILTL